MRLLLLFLLAAFNSFLAGWLDSYTNYDRLSSYAWESDEFRALKLGEAIAGEANLDGDAVAALMVEHGFDLTGFKLRTPLSIRYPKERTAGFKKLSAAYGMLFDDLKYFPVPKSLFSETPDVSYSDGWMEKRSYGGERGHEGCDIMGSERERGFYPVVSITDGIVETVGWLEKGGWRIGIRAPSGAYFYYAHLYRYEKEWSEGDEVRAGELLGYMGDSGYGPEGTTGMFDVHLHLGVYLKTDHYEELSVNPYWILRFLEKYRLEYAY